jgi:eukaryotic-like serine/threonine-protein kinase
MAVRRKRRIAPRALRPEPAPWDSADPALVASLLAPRYTEERLLGRGAVACTHLVREAATGRAVVARVVHWAIARDDSARAHIRRLTRAGLALEHPNIVRTFAMSPDTERVPWAICEFVDGPDLGTLRARQQPFPVGAAVRVAYGVAAALEAAHAKGLVHGSLRPSDVLVDPKTGDAKVYEFDSPLFGDLGFLGKPRYASPEQLQDPGSGPRAPSDVFALGVILHEMLTGEDPFPGGSTMQQMVRKLDQPPIPLRRRRPDAPAALEALLVALLAAEPRGRPAAAAARAALEALLQAG